MKFQLWVGAALVSLSAVFLPVYLASGCQSTTLASAISRAAAMSVLQHLGRRAFKEHAHGLAGLELRGSRMIVLMAHNEFAAL